VAIEHVSIAIEQRSVGIERRSIPIERVDTRAISHPSACVARDAGELEEKSPARRHNGPARDFNHVRAQQRRRMVLRQAPSIAT
jgi:hypothetical protein